MSDRALLRSFDSHGILVQQAKRTKVENTDYFDIPQLCYETIFENLDMEDQIRLRLVNKTWDRILTSMISKLIIGGNHIEKCLDKFSQARDLTLVGNVKNLRLEKYNVKRLTLIQLVPQLKLLNGTQIEYINWVGNYTHSKKCLFKLFTSISKMKTVKTLVLSDKYKWCGKCLPMYEQMTSLEELRFDQCEDICVRQISNISTLPNLKRLSLIDCKTNDYIGLSVEIVDRLLEMPNLELFEISEGMISDSHLEILIKANKFEVNVVESVWKTFIEMETDESTDSSGSNGIEWDYPDEPGDSWDWSE